MVTDNRVDHNDRLCKSEWFSSKLNKEVCRHPLSACFIKYKKLTTEVKVLFRQKERKRCWKRRLFG